MLTELHLNVEHQVEVYLQVEQNVDLFPVLLDYTSSLASHNYNTFNGFATATSDHC